MPASVRQCEVFVPSPSPGTSVTAASYYCSVKDNSLVSIHYHTSRSDTADAAYVRRSTDNGRSWSEAQLWPTKFDAAGGTGRRHLRGGYIDTRTGRFIHVWTEGVLPTDDPLEGMKRWILCYSVSEDEGRTTAFRKQIVHEGAEFDETHPIPGVTVGKNSMMVGDLTCRPLPLDDGTILFPIQSSPTGPDGEYWNPCGSRTYSDALVLRGRWNADGQIDWRASERVKGDPQRTTRGLIEPTLAQLADGRLLMVMRGSNEGKLEVPGHKWFSLSSDEGRTWSEASPWTYADGEAFFSPSACSQLVRHSSGKLFWFGNISARNTRGNSPRYPLVLAEVDRDTGLLLRDTVTALDDRKPGEAERLTLSNFCVREDRETADLMLHMTRHFAAPPAEGKSPWTADAMLYHIGLE